MTINLDTIMVYSYIFKIPNYGNTNICVYAQELGLGLSNPPHFTYF